jgi:hypothetical protein
LWSWGNVTGVGGSSGQKGFVAEDDRRKPIGKQNKEKQTNKKCDHEISRPRPMLKPLAECEGKGQKNKNKNQTRETKQKENCLFIRESAGNP